MCRKVLYACAGKPTSSDTGVVVLYTVLTGIEKQGKYPYVYCFLLKQHCIDCIKHTKRFII